MYSDMSKRISSTPSERELLGHFGLADAGGAGEQIVADRLFRFAQARARQLDRRGQRLDRLVLAEDHALQVLLEVGSCSASSFETVLGGMRAMVAMDASISLRRWSSCACSRAPASAIAPTSSITSIALSGSLRS
jgi:hypothetical protein